MSDIITVTADSGKVPATTRTIEEITAEAIRHQMDGADAVIGLGNCLMEAKEQLQHGAWLSWLSENLNLSERSAQRLMTIARNCSNPTALSDLGKTKVLAILTLPPAEQTLFLDGDYVPEGADKSVSEMSTRELQQLIRERDEARMEAESARADANAAEEARQTMEKQVDFQRRQAEAAKERAEVAEHKLLGANDIIDKTEAEAAALREEVRELKDRPVDVAVQRDEAAIEKARQEVRDEMAKELKAAHAETETLQQQIKETREALAEAEENAKTGHLEDDADISTFKAYFDKTQEFVNKMNGILLKIVRKDPETARKLGKALIALSDAIKKEAAV